MTSKNCPVCDSEIGKPTAIESGLELDCKVCGRFQIPQELLEDGITPPVPKDRRYLISAWLRNRRNPRHVVERLTRRDLELIYENCRDFSASEKQDLFLQAIADQSSWPGDTVSLEAISDYPLAYARSPEEFKFYHAALHNRGWVSGRLGGLQVTADGWDRISALSTTPISSDQAFVAMWFDPQMDSAWDEGILPAIESAGLTPFRVDREPHIDRIDAKIISEIRASRILVAEVTGQRQGVYFEAGYALGLGIPVFWCCRSDDMASAHFDTRQFNHVLWKTPEELKSQLGYLITALI